MTAISVVVPSYRRAASLRRCLDGLGCQASAADEIIVVLRREDIDSQKVVAQHGPATTRTVLVDAPGVLRAMYAGARVSTGDIVAFIDDDAVAPQNWLERLTAHMFDDVGAVGGRDRIAGQEEPRTTDVGRVTTWGKVVGNHHLGAGGVRDVDILKGVNMAIRRQAIAIPDGLKGEGAQNHFEIAMSLHVRQAGWRVLYDPAITVDHFPAARHDNDARGNPDADATRAAAFNMVFCLLTFRPQLTGKRALYGLVLGDRGVPGLIRGLAALIRREPDVTRAALPSLRGQFDALRLVRSGERVRMLALDDPLLHV